MKKKKNFGKLLKIGNNKKLINNNKTIEWEFSLKGFSSYSW